MRADIVRNLFMVFSLAVFAAGSDANAAAAKASTDRFDTAKAFEKYKSLNDILKGQATKLRPSVVKFIKEKTKYALDTPIKITRQGQHKIQIEVQGVFIRVETKGRDIYNRPQLLVNGQEIDTHNGPESIWEQVIAILPKPEEHKPDRQGSLFDLVAPRAFAGAEEKVVEKGMSLGAKALVATGVAGAAGSGATILYATSDTDDQTCAVLAQGKYCCSPEGWYGHPSQLDQLWQTISNFNFKLHGAKSYGIWRKADESAIADTAMSLTALNVQRKHDSGKMNRDGTSTELYCQGDVDDFYDCVYDRLKQIPDADVKKLGIDAPTCIALMQGHEKQKQLNCPMTDTSHGGKSDAAG